jgi:colicin import membrane protein
VIWTVRQYGLPLLLALALHAALGFWLQGTWERSRSESDIFKPKVVNSTLLVLEPKAKPTPPPSSQSGAQPKPQPDRAAEARAAAAREEAARREEAAKKAAAEKARADREAQEKARQELARQKAAEEEATRQQRLQALADTSFLNSLEDETVDLAEAASADAEAVAQSYRYGIYQKVVANWSRPPSARNGMEARLQVELVPTGDVVAVMLIESSGSSAFDRSAEQAVKKARRFEVPEEGAIFEQYFRRFTLLFKPEDLLR